jgi:hypothetical protein
MRAEYRLRVFENRVLRRILRPKRRPHNGELYNLHAAPNIIGVIK